MPSHERGDFVKKLEKPPLTRHWYVCPVCGMKLAIRDNTARCHGIYIKCRACKREIEIKI